MAVVERTGGLRSCNHHSVVGPSENRLKDAGRIGHDDDDDDALEAQYRTEMLAANGRRRKRFK